MMFSDLRKGFQVHVLNTEGVPSYEVGKVVAYSEPKFLQKDGQYMIQQRVIDLTVETKSATDTYTVPEMQNVAKSSSVTLATEIGPIMNELEAMKRTSREVLESVPMHRQRIESCDKILEEVNPSFRQSKEQDRKIERMDKRIDGISDSLEELKKIIIERLK